MPRLHLFVYGTLQPSARTGMALWMRQRLVSSVAASVPGRLFAIPDSAISDREGWFPALVPAKSARRVRGILCELELSRGELALLDRYERAEYRRIAAPVRTAGRARAVAQLYRWRGSLPEQARPIPSGDFLAWLNDRRLEAFSALPGGASSALATRRSSH